jgi:hypothetical protein
MIHRSVRAAIAAMLAAAAVTSDAAAQRQSFTLWQLQSNTITMTVTQPGTIWVLASWSGEAQRVGIGTASMVAATLPLAVTLTGPSQPSSGGGTFTAAPLRMRRCTAEQKATAGHECFDDGKQTVSVAGAMPAAGGSSGSPTHRTRRVSTSQQGEMLRETVTAADVAIGPRWTVTILNPTAATSQLTGLVCVRFVPTGGPPPPACR